MKINCYLIITQGGSVRTTKLVPSLAQNEVAIKLNVNLSDKFFERFIPQAKLSVPDDFILTPEMEVKLLLPDGSDYAEAIIKGKGEK
jgi:hypothetical protein